MNRRNTLRYSALRADPACGKTLPASHVAPVVADDRRNMVFGWIVTLIPRVGIVRPF